MDWLWPDSPVDASPWQNGRTGSEAGSRGEDREASADTHREPAALVGRRILADRLRAVDHGEVDGGVEPRGMRAALRSITPLIPAGKSLTEALAFFTEHMGFVATWRAGEMAGVRRDGVSLTLVANDNRGWSDNASFSVGVSDLEALYQEYSQIPATVGPLEQKAWGRREFHMVVASGVCLQFYQDDPA